ncbi:hypothetical protein AVEN_130688-1 [Araneus ventricosus]|uniref:Uncharacterized protein n=1 Tax=Araneus ventricosus TaxID=182803 RepID=A0A4Y2U8U1_ARAVE|nr:hypothetical protein AVEN_32495-1 [Araneus ventricosus]GBO09238.1 hypothetical protein AVEN_130688-1 [Araneus ventricosus]
MNWTRPTWVVIYPTPCYNLSVRRMEMGCGWQALLDSQSNLSPKRFQNLTSPQKNPTTSDRSSSLWRGRFYTVRDRLAWCERVKYKGERLVVLLERHCFLILDSIVRGKARCNRSPDVIPDTLMWQRMLLNQRALGPESSILTTRQKEFPLSGGRY